MRDLLPTGGIAASIRRILVPVLLILPLAAFTPRENIFAPSAELWQRWERHDPDSTATVDYAVWDRLLKTYVRRQEAGASLFDYAAVTPEDRTALDAFISRLAALPVDRYDRAQQFAYWVNLYNALTVQVVLDHYPVDSIRDIDISPGWFSDGPWDKKLVTVAGEDISLNDIEHRILRPIWADPRIHYAVNCASIGCPDLRAEAFVGERLDEMLDDAARTYINSPRGVSIDGSKVTVSKIYDWFYEDFGRSTDSLLAHLIRYAEPPLAEELAAIGDIEDTAYDWSLNGVPANPS